MKKIKATILVTVIMVLVSLTVGIVSEAALIKNKENKNIEKTDDGPYNGRLIVYVVEPVSRWSMQDGNAYHFGFLDFASDDILSIEYLDTYTNIITWDANDAGYINVRENNIMAMAAVFNPESHKKYAYPPASNPFDAYYVDAAAAATPGTTGYNTVTENFTHTVFCEKATKTTCPYCPSAGIALENIYNSQDYPFYFVSMVGNKNNKAYDRLRNEYNFYGYPTCFFDGGYKVRIGSSSESSYRNSIRSSGLRDVHELDLNIYVEWIGDGVIQIEINITNNEETTNHPPIKPTITGNTKGSAGKEYEYTFSAIDPDGDDVYYWIEWFEGCPGVNWIGPYTSGEEVTFYNTWSEQGTYTIQAKAKDVFNEESDWATFEVSMSKIRKFSPISFRFFDWVLRIFDNLLN